MSLIAGLLLATTIQVAPDGWTTSLAELPKRLDDGDAIWTWSDDCAPQRLTTLKVAPCAATDEVTVRVVASRRTTAPSEIRWGTEAMIRELPDSLLPIASSATPFRIPKGERVYARVAGPSLASGWLELHPGEQAIRASDAAGGTINVGDDRARMEIRTLDATQPHGLMFRACGDGTLVLPPLPASGFVKLLVWSDRSAPVSLNAATQKPPAKIALPPGFAIHGRVIDEQHKSLAGATITALFLLGGRETTVQKHAVSARDGAWHLGGLPLADVELQFDRAPLAAAARVVRVTGEADLGDAILWRARDVPLHVTDDRGAPVPRASVSTSDGVTATTDERGTATLRRIPASSVSVSATATGYHKTSVRLADKIAEPVTIKLLPATRVRARIVADGKPAGPGSADIEFNERKASADFDQSGELHVDNLDAGTLSLEIRVAGYAPFRVPPRAVAAGELVDLGVITLERGLSIVGRTIDEVSGVPIAGVTVRVLRPNSFGPILSYLRQEWLAAESDADGVFRLRGAAPGVYSLWTEASARAPLVRNGVTVAAQPPGGEVDLGDLTIPAAHLLRVKCEPAPRCGSDASVLLAGADWLPLRSSLMDGAADVGPLPAGAAVLRLSDRRGIIHQRDVTVAAGDATTEVAVKLPSVTIAGVVTRGGTPVSGGTVTMTNAPGQPSRFVQWATPRGAGTLGNEVFGTAPRDMTVPVSEDGRFEFRDATPGDYDVVWTSDGWPSPPKRVSIPETAAASIAIDVPTSTLQGIVRSSDGSAPKRVLVAFEQRGHRMQTLASSDGSFSFAVERGPAAVRATDISGARAERDLVVDDDVQHIDLTLEEAARQKTTVLVTSRGAPLSNAFVFLSGSAGMHAATTSADGQASFELRTNEQVLSVAAFSAVAGWGFGGAGASEVDIPGSSGALVIKKATGSAAVAVESPSGFPIQEALATLGIPPIAYSTSPLRLSGIPAGTYRVMAGGVMKAQRVTDGVHEIDF